MVKLCNLCEKKLSGKKRIYCSSKCRKRSWKLNHPLDAERKRRKGANTASNRRRHKDAAFAVYGNKCACCGESLQVFLTIDHVNNDGAEERRKGLRSASLYYYISINGLSERYQLLCQNCNFAKYRLGKCPHIHLIFSPREIEIIGKEG